MGIKSFQFRSAGGGGGGGGGTDVSVESSVARRLFVSSSFSLDDESSDESSPNRPQLSAIAGIGGVTIVAIFWSINPCPRLFCNLPRGSFFA